MAAPTRDFRKIQTTWHTRAMCRSKVEENANAAVVVVVVVVVVQRT